MSNQNVQVEGKGVARELQQGRGGRQNVGHGNMGAVGGVAGVCSGVLGEVCRVGWGGRGGAASQWATMAFATTMCRHHKQTEV